MGFPAYLFHHCLSQKYDQVEHYKDVSLIGSFFLMDRFEHLELKGNYLFSCLIRQWRKCSLPCLWIFSYLIPLGAFVLQGEKHKNNCTISTKENTISKVKSSMYTPNTEPNKFIQHGSNKHSFSHWQSPLPPAVILPLSWAPILPGMSR